MTARLSVLVGLFLLALGAPSAARAQESATRFEIISVGDTTFTFRVGAQEGWVRSGLTGIAVDPRRRDLLIARFRLVEVKEGEAVALVTGQTTLVETSHVALVTRPPTPWYRQYAFWAGLLAGAAIGVAATP